jgi:hypothetical protein
VVVVITRARRKPLGAIALAGVEPAIQRDGIERLDALEEGC